MKKFNEEFKKNLYETIEDIENHSLTEAVAVVKSESGDYKNVSLWFAFAVMALLYTFFMFAPVEFNVYVIYLVSLFSFPLSYFIVEFLPVFKRLLVPNTKLHKQAEIYARAVFQKGGIRFTQERIGVLFYVSLFEKSVVIVADRGAETAVPAEDWERMKMGFTSIFSASNPAEAFIEKLQETKPVFAENIPPVENDINELPDDLEVEL
ncbi:MAG: TPM domain-containing protein [Bacteroidota bacterium]|nr:TPM domain-containing protein [Bacteroidota bacterium]